MKRTFNRIPLELSAKKRKPHEPLRDAKEVAAMFGYASAGSLHVAANSGAFPKPDFCFKQLTHRRMYWKLSTLEAEKKRRAKYYLR